MADFSLCVHHFCPYPVPLFEPWLEAPRNAAKWTALDWSTPPWIPRDLLQRKLLFVKVQLDGLRLRHGAMVVILPPVKKRDQQSMKNRSKMIPYISSQFRLGNDYHPSFLAMQAGRCLDYHSTQQRDKDICDKVPPQKKNALHQVSLHRIQDPPMTQFTPGFMVDIQVLSGLVCTSYGAKQSPADFAPTSQVKRLSKNRGGPLASQPLLLTPSLQDQKGGASNGGFP